MTTVFSLYERCKQLKQLRDELEQGGIPCADWGMPYSQLDFPAKTKCKPSARRLVVRKKRTC